MNQKIFKNKSISLLNVLMLTAIALFSSCATNQQAEQEKPNIIYIMTDDHAWQALSCYGSTRNETPHLDRLAEEGMRFDRAFVTNSICAPSRATLLTGKYSHVNGQLTNMHVFDGDQMTFPKLLQKAGYKTAMIGKWHLRSEPQGFDYWKVLPGQGSYYNPDFIEMGKEYRDTGYVTDLVTDDVINWIDTLDRSQPFCVLYHQKAPHRQWWPGPDHLTTYEDVTFDEPETLFDEYIGRKAAQEAMMEIDSHMFLSKDLKIKPEFVKEKDVYPDNLRTRSYDIYMSRYNRMTPEQQEMWDKAYAKRNREFQNPDLTGKALVRWKYQQYMKDYLRCIASVDDNVGRLMKYLKDNNLDENTIVVYTSDQGFYLGEHGWFDKRFMYKESLKMPLIVRYPNAIAPGSTNEDFVMNLDFAPTFLDYAGVEIPSDIQGKSLKPVLEGNTPGDWRSRMYYHYYEYPGYHMVKRHYGIRTEKYKLMHFYYDIDQWELYDLEKDPHEMNNLINDPDYQSIAEDLKTQLEDLRKKYGDTDEQAREYIEKWNERPFVKRARETGMYLY